MADPTRNGTPKRAAPLPASPGAGPKAPPTRSGIEPPEARRDQATGALLIAHKSMHKKAPLWERIVSYPFLARRGDYYYFDFGCQFVIKAHILFPLLSLVLSPFPGRFNFIMKAPAVDDSYLQSTVWGLSDRTELFMFVVALIYCVGFYYWFRRTLFRCNVRNWIERTSKPLFVWHVAFWYVSSVLSQEAYWSWVHPDMFYGAAFAHHYFTIEGVFRFFIFLIKCIIWFFD